MTGRRMLRVYIVRVGGEKTENRGEGGRKWKVDVGSEEGSRG